MRAILKSTCPGRLVPFFPPNVPQLLKWCCKHFLELLLKPQDKNEYCLMLQVSSILKLFAQLYLWLTRYDTERCFTPSKNHTSPQITKICHHLGSSIYPGTVYESNSKKEFLAFKSTSVQTESPDVMQVTWIQLFTIMNRTVLWPYRLHIISKNCCIWSLREGEDALVRENQV